MRPSRLLQPFVFQGYSPEAASCNTGRGANDEVGHGSQDPIGVTLDTVEQQVDGCLGDFGKVKVNCGQRRLGQSGPQAVVAGREPQAPGNGAAEVMGCAERTAGEGIDRHKQPVDTGVGPQQICRLITAQFLAARLGETDEDRLGAGAQYELPVSVGGLRLAMDGTSTLRDIWPARRTDA